VPGKWCHVFPHGFFPRRVGVLSSKLFATGFFPHLLLRRRSLLVNSCCLTSAFLQPGGFSRGMRLHSRLKRVTLAWAAVIPLALLSLCLYTILPSLLSCEDSFFAVHTQSFFPLFLLDYLAPPTSPYLSQRSLGPPPSLSFFLRYPFPFPFSPEELF